MLGWILAIWLLLCPALPAGAQELGEAVCFAAEEPWDEDWNLYFGRLEKHDALEQNPAQPEDPWAAGAGLDFYGASPHSDGLTRESWEVFRDSAPEEMTALAGFEVTWPRERYLGHISTFGAWDLQKAADHPSLTDYYERLSALEGAVSQFNHPGEFWGDFEAFAGFQPRYENAVQLLELENGDEPLIAALNAGWRVAPTMASRGERTVVLAQSKDPASVLDALSARRVYATQDGDLHLVYRMDGQIMGSVLQEKDIHTLSVRYYDPTDPGPVQLQVVADGQCLAEATLDGELTITLPGGYGYYYLRLSQGDGDTAYTAPVWVAGAPEITLETLKTDPQVPVENREFSVEFTLSNREGSPFTLQKAELLADGIGVFSEELEETVAPYGSFSSSLPITIPESGNFPLTVKITGTLAGEVLTREEDLTVTVRPPELVSGILIDAGHENAGLGDLNNLRTLAADCCLEVTELRDTLPQGGEVLIVTAPGKDLEDSFVQYAADFAKNGGIVILCGRAGEGSRLNPIPEAAGSTLRLRDDTALDEVNNGGVAYSLFPFTVQSTDPWCRSFSPAQFYSHQKGCTVTGGSWLVRGFDTTHSSLSPEGKVTLLAWEQVGEGTIFAAGSLFLTDGQMPFPANSWEKPWINLGLLQQILRGKQENPDITPISQVRKGQTGTLYRIQGYATSGTSNPHTTFPGELYLQDDTGGIVVTAFSAPVIQVGAPLDITGILREKDGNPALEVLNWELRQESYYRHVPRIFTCREATDYPKRGGQLVQLMAQVTQVTPTADGKGLKEIRVTDYLGDSAIIFIEDCIRSGADGTNTLAEDIRPGRTILAMGLLHKNSSGEPVLRVRNCEEVVYLPPLRDETNPQTADPWERLRQAFLCFWRSW